MRIWFFGIVLFLIVVNGLLIGLASMRYPLNAAFVSAGVCLNCYLILFLLLGNRQFQSNLEVGVRQGHGRVLCFLLSLFVPYLIYALGTESFSWLSCLKLALYIGLPTLVILTLRKFSGQLLWQDVFVVLALWLPLDFRWMRGVWAWPNGSLAYSFNSLLATCLGVYLFVCLRRLDRVGYQFNFQGRDWLVGFRNFLLFAPIAIPLGFYTGFIAVSKHFATPWSFILSALGIFFFIAIPEELLFRGILQNFAERILPHPVPALIFSSLLFGASHLNNGPKPDWRYFLLATIAGLFYGNAYIKTRKLLAPAIVHTLVDTVWRGFFR
jgi:membrane protease YdiL (CAAX protease family)